MARGDMIIFDQFILDLGQKIHDLDGDDWQIGFVNNTTVPTRDTSGPHWGGTGTTNFATNQVSTGGTSYTGPVSLASEAFTEAVANTFRWDAADPTTWSQDASGPTDIYWAIIFNNTDANKRCAAAIDMGGPVSLVSGDVTVSFNANGIFQIT